MSHLISCGDATQLHVDRLGYIKPCRCQLCQTLGGINSTVPIEDSMKKKNIHNLRIQLPVICRL